MSITCFEILQKLPHIFSEIHGNDQTQITDIAPVEDGRPGTLIFLSNDKHFDTAIKSNAAAIVLTANLFKKALDSKTQKTLLVAKNVQLAWALTTQTFFPYDPRLWRRDQTFHPSAVIGKNTTIHHTVKIDPHAVIGDDVIIGENSWVGASAVIQNNVQIGSNVKIFPQVFIGSDCKIGNNCEIKPHSTVGSEGYGYAQDEMGHHHRIPQRGNVVLEDNVSVGANCTIDRATFKSTIIKEGTKLDNLVHVGHNCKIGKHGLFVSGILFAGSTEVGDHNIYGGQTGVAGHLKITDHVHLGGRAAVTSDITKSGAYGGYPLQPLKEHFKSTSSIIHLPRMRKQIHKIMKHLNLKDEEE